MSLPSDGKSPLQPHLGIKGRERKSLQYVSLFMRASKIRSLEASVHLRKDEHSVPLSLELVQQPIEKLQLARLLQQLLGGRVHHIVGEGRGDEVRVVAVLSHLHDHVVQLGLGYLPAAFSLLLLCQHLLQGIRFCQIRSFHRLTRQWALAAITNIQNPLWTWP